MDSHGPAPDRVSRFRTLYDAAYLDLLGFARRRVHASHAEDVVSEVMLVAWRRLDEVPTAESDARAWLFGVARHTLQSTRRREGRQGAVAVHLAEVSAAVPTADVTSAAVAARVDLAAAWPRLSAIHQEALALAVLEELSSPEAARVLGISPTAFRLRLSRARRSLRSLLDSPQPDAQPSSAVDPERSHR